MQKSINLKIIAIVHIKKSAYRICFSDMTKREAKKLMTNSHFTDKKRYFIKILFYFFIMYIKMDNTTYYQRNRKILLNRAKDYYENNKERLKEQAKSKYRNVSEEDKTIKREYGKNRYHNTSEEKKQELREYLKRKYWEAKESLFKYCVYSSVKYSDLRDFLKA